MNIHLIYAAYLPLLLLIVVILIKIKQNYIFVATNLYSYSCKIIFCFQMIFTCNLHLFLFKIVYIIFINSSFIFFRAIIYTVPNFRKIVTKEIYEPIKILPK
ncbi:hypothetical protein H311_00048 [Anncaliia algerae PRA109]|nr:hypothetical protein H311_00048 [Anncaliia algerae PRA109]